MSQILLKLGSHFFYSPRVGEASPGFQTIERDSSFTWASQQRLSSHPAMQFTGAGSDIIQIEGRLYPHLFGGLKTLENLRETGNAGKPVLLSRYYVVSDPKAYVAENIGKYAMTRLRRRELKIGGDGLPVSMEFSLELQKYGDDPVGEFFFT